MSGHSIARRHARRLRRFPAGQFRGCAAAAGNGARAADGAFSGRGPPMRSDHTHRDDVFQRLVHGHVELAHGELFGSITK